MTSSTLLDSFIPTDLEFLNDTKDLPGYKRSMYTTLLDFHIRAISRGSEVDSFGWDLFTEHTEGVQPGWYLFAGAPNLGKTAVALQMAWQIAHRNDNYYCVFLTLDDNAFTVIPRICAVETRTPMRVFSAPLRYTHIPEYQEAYIRGLKSLGDSSSKFLLLDQDIGSEIEGIRDYIQSLTEELRSQGSDKTVAFFVDGFHDLTTRNKTQMNNKNDRYSYISEEIKKIVGKFHMPFFCTAEVTKIGARRPSLEDVRETGNIGFKANVVLGIYNEVGIKGEAAEIYYRSTEDGPKLPVVEVQFLKNKLSSYKGRLYYQFVPEMSYLHECEEELRAYYETRLQE